MPGTRAKAILTGIGPLLPGPAGMDLVAHLDSRLERPYRSPPEIAGLIALDQTGEGRSDSGAVHLHAHLYSAGRAGRPGEHTHGHRLAGLRLARGALVRQGTVRVLHTEWR